jgi:hypothetical protein
MSFGSERRYVRARVTLGIHRAGYGFGGQVFTARLTLKEEASSGKLAQLKRITAEAVPDRLSAWCAAGLLSFTCTAVCVRVSHSNLESKNVVAQVMFCFLPAPGP